MTLAWYRIRRLDLMIMKVAVRSEAMLNPYLVQHLGCGVYGLGLGDEGAWFRVGGLRFRI